MRREFNLLTNERLAVLIILLFAATAYSLLIGNLYRGGIVQRIPVAVCDLEDSPLSRELIRAVADADQYNFLGTLSDDSEAVKLLERGEVAAGIYFKTKLALVQAMVFYTLPAFLLSGYIWPEVGMAEIIRWISMLQPVHYILTDFRILSLTGFAPQINQHAAILFSIGSVSFILLYGFLFFDERPALTN